MKRSVPNNAFVPPGPAEGRPEDMLRDAFFPHPEEDRRSVAKDGGKMLLRMKAWGVQR